MANRSSNRAAVPEAKGALDKFKYEVASELGVPLTDGYNGDLSFYACNCRKCKKSQIKNFRRDGHKTND